MSLLNFSPQSRTVILSQLNTIHQNLALEAAIASLVKSAAKSQASNPAKALLLWSNRACIVFGRNQNPWREFRVQEARQNGIDICRRLTGGGCVYQDEGNMVFSFITKTPEVAEDNKLLIRALHKLGISGVTSKRNDILWRDRKFSGAAFQKGKDLFIHHGTLLRDLNVDDAQFYLTPHNLKFRDKIPTTKSVESRIINLVEIRPSLTHKLLAGALRDEYEPTKTHTVDKYHELIGHPAFQETLKTLTDPDWIFGSTPPFETTVTLAGDCLTEVAMDVHDGKVRDIQVYSDSLDVQEPSRFEAQWRDKLIGLRFEEANKLLGLA